MSADKRENLKALLRVFRCPKIRLKLHKPTFWLLFLYVFSESTFLLADEAKFATIWEVNINDFTNEYPQGVEALLSNYEKELNQPLRPGKFGRVGLKINTRGGLGLSTPKKLLSALIRSLEARGYPRNAIYLVDYSSHRIKSSGYDLLMKDGGLFFEGCPVIALDSSQYFESDWFYDSPLPRLPKTKIYQDNAELLGSFKSSDPKSRKSFLPIPLMFEMDFWINLAVCVDEPVLGVDGALANASLWNISNHRRFLVNPSTAAVAIAEVLAVPELKQAIEFHMISLETYQFIGGPAFNSLYTSSLPYLWMSKDPVALDSLLIDLINRDRRTNGFDEISLPNLQLVFAAKIGLGHYDKKLIRKKTISID